MADKVLIVDDDISICKLLEKVMHSMNLIQKQQEVEEMPWNC